VDIRYHKVLNLRNKVSFYVAAASTAVAGILHLALVPMYFSVMSIDVTVFFIVSGLAQLFWVIPIIKRWNKLWYYIGIGGTTVLIIMWIVAVPGSGYPVDGLQIVTEVFQIIFIITCSFIISKGRIKAKLDDIDT
jgi:uncharacterized membrane protein YuzA (DUF378 family)